MKWLVAFWPVSRRRHRRLAEDYLVCRTRQMYVEALLEEAERHHTDQVLHWWAWWELYRTFEVLREERHAHPNSTPAPGALPTVGPHGDAPGDRSAGGDRFNFPV